MFFVRTDICVVLFSDKTWTARLWVVYKMWSTFKGLTSVSYFGRDIEVNYISAKIEIDGETKQNIVYESND